jgi:hypothetical protein
MLNLQGRIELGSIVFFAAVLAPPTPSPPLIANGASSLSFVSNFSVSLVRADGRSERHK